MWYGSAALQEVPKIHEKIQKESFLNSYIYLTKFKS